MTALVERLAAAALNCTHVSQHHVPLVACGHCVRDALRAALREAARVAREHEFHEDHDGTFCGDAIAAAIEALAK